MDKKLCSVIDSDRKCFNHQAIQTSHYNKNGKDEGIITAVICAGFYPNICRAEKSENLSIPPTLWQNKERLHIHSASVNHNKTLLDSEWLVFFEKFKVNKKISLSTTCTIKPYAILLFASGDKALQVKHLDRQVVVNGWIQLSVAAKTGVMFRELRSKLNGVLEDMFDQKKMVNNQGYSYNDDPFLMGIVNLLRSQ